MIRLIFRVVALIDRFSDPTRVLNGLVGGRWAFGGAGSARTVDTESLRKARAAARTAARQIYRAQLKTQIGWRYRRRSGSLLRVRVRGSGRGESIKLREDFPHTHFVTVRRGQGQYAYVLNSRSNFIQTARRIAYAEIRAITALRYVQFLGE